MAIRLTATEFEVAWEAMRLGDLPLIFRVCVERRGLTESERAGVVGGALDGLRRRGHADGRGIGAELAAALTVLADPRWTVDGRLDVGRPIRAYGAAGHGDEAVLATLDGDRMLISGSSTYRLPADLVSLAGEVPPGPGRSINVPVGVLLGAAGRCGGDSGLLGDELTGHGVPPGDASMIARLNAERTGGGQFGVETADPDGVLRRAPRVVGFGDCPLGRWAQLTTAGTGGQQWITFTPARLTQLAAMIVELLAERGVRPA